MELKYELNQKQTLSQHMVQSREILQMSAVELEAYIENLSMENPVIELDESGHYEADTSHEDLQRKLDWLEATDMQNRVYYQQEREDEEQQQNWRHRRDTQEDLQEYLRSQLLFASYSAKERSALEFMIQSLDSRGYFTEEISFVSQYCAVPVETVEKLLLDLQGLDPAGVGARDLKECLILQLRRKEGRQSGEKISLAESLLDFMDEIAKNHLSEIAKKLRLPMEEIVKACNELRKLNPKPGSSFSSREQLRYISPDVVVVKLQDRFEILINEYQYPGFSISAYYQKMQRTTEDKEARGYLTKMIQQAEWVRSCINQRSATLLRVMGALVEHQKEFFAYGILHKCPMGLSDIAEKLNLHESTVSRTLRGKYLQCAWGVFPLNYFLTTTVTKAPGQQGEKTPEQVKAMIRQVIDGEDKKRPYSDQTISERLKELGVEISRRTVNKYRQEMQMPDKSGRKEW